MITIKLFGAMRLKTGLHTMEVYADSIKEACRLLSKATGLPEKEFRNCTYAINGKKVKASSPLHDGDELVFLTPSGGG